MSITRRTFHCRAAAVIAAVCLPAAARAETYDAPIIRDEVFIPLRDGVRLGATLYLPAETGGPWPVILAATPYGRAGAGESKGFAMARAGFVFVTCDVRGRGDSGGVFVPHVNEGRDMYDAVEWLAAQSFSTGAVGLWGSSYSGYIQWAAAALRPPHLKSIQPAASPLPGFDSPMNRDIMPPYAATWLAYVSGREAHTAFFADRAYQARRYAYAYRTGRPFAELDSILGFPSATFQKWIRHPTYDAYWQSQAPKYGAIDIPILSITGYWDAEQKGALENYRRYMEVAGAEAKSRNFLIIGPFDHAGTRFPGHSVGGVPVPSNGVIDMQALDVAWFGWTLRGDPRPAFLKDHLAYYDLGPDEWRYLPTLEGLSHTRQAFYLDPEKQDCGSVASPGRLAAKAPSPSLRHYRYDPADFRRLELGDWFGGAWLTNDLDVQSLRGDGLIYETAPLNAPLLLAGRPAVDLFVSLDTPDTDLRAKLYEISADGKSLLLGYDHMRVRHRGGIEQSVLARPGEIYRLLLNEFPVLVRTVAAGKRLRLVIDAPDSQFDQRNFNSGKPVAFETVADARVATVTLRHGGSFASRLTLPLA